MATKKPSTVKPKKITKKKLASLARSAKAKSWKAVADAVRQRDNNVCAVCGLPNPKLNVHHLLPREIKEHWLNPMNLIALCPKHHKFCYQQSFHKNPIWSIFWLQKHRPDQYQWCLDNLAANNVDILAGHNVSRINTQNIVADSGCVGSDITVQN